jgi:SRSO17 transposase
MGPPARARGRRRCLRQRHKVPPRPTRYRAGVHGGYSADRYVWLPGKEPLPPKPGKSIGRPLNVRQGSPNHQLILARKLNAGLDPADWPTVTWRSGAEQELRPRFAAVRVRLASRNYWRCEPLPEQWLLIEWPEDGAQPTKYWLGTLAADSSLTALVATARQNWIIERDYEELKQELGLGHYERRGWRGFTRHLKFFVSFFQRFTGTRRRPAPSSRPQFP